MKFGTEGGGGLFDSLISGLLKTSVDKITEKVNEVQKNVIGSSGSSSNNFAASVDTENSVEQGSESDAETNVAEESEPVSDSEAPSPEGTSEDESQVEESQAEETPVEEAQAEDQPAEEEQQESCETPSESQPEEESQESEPAESEPLTEAASAEGEGESEETSSEEEPEEATTEGEPAGSTDESSNSNTQVEAEVAAAPDSPEGDQTEQTPAGEESGEASEADSAAGSEEEEGVSPAIGNLPLNLLGNLRSLISVPDANAKGMVNNRHVPSTHQAPDAHHAPEAPHVQDAAGHSNVLDLEALKRQLMRHEGYRKTRYFDSLKIPTIGIGFNLTKTGGRQRIEALGLNYDQVVAGTLSLSDAQIQQLFMDDVMSSISDVQRALTPAVYAHLSSVRKLVVVDMMFNMGIGTFSKFHNMIAALQAGDWKTTADHMQQSLWYKQVQGRGAELVAMMRSDAISKAAATVSA